MNQPRKGCEWVFAGEGRATEKRRSLSAFASVPQRGASDRECAAISQRAARPNARAALSPRCLPPWARVPVVGAAYVVVLAQFKR